MSSLDQEIFLKPTDVPGAVLTKEPSSCGVTELKRWLECHGQKKSGKKQELIDRVNDCISLKLCVDPKVDGGKWYDLKSNQKPNAPQSVNITTNYPEAGWKPFPTTDIPLVFNYGHVYHYLVESITNVMLLDDDSEHGESMGVDCEDTVTTKPLRKG